MGISIEMTKAYLDIQSMHYHESQDGRALIVGIGGLSNIGKMNIAIIFDDDEDSVALRAHNICTVPDNKTQEMYKTCSQVNARFRWIKFYVDSGEGVVNAEDDAVIQPETCGEEIFELVIKMAQITDSAYPFFMRTLWA